MVLKNAPVLFWLVWCLGSCGQFVKYEGAVAVQDEDSADIVTFEGYPKVQELGHYELAGLLAKFTSASEDGGDVYLDYTSWSKDKEALYVLNRYLATLSSIDPSTLKDEHERFAYWINAYNATTIRGVLDKFEGDTGFSVIASGVFFDEPNYAYGGTLLSLNQIEQGVLRGQMDHASVLGASEEVKAKIMAWHGSVFASGVVDARLHAALNCGALGCPNLWSKAPFVYQGAVLDTQLEEKTRAWLADAHKGAGPNGISNLFEWYRSDFEAEFGSVSTWINAHRDGGLDGVDISTILTYDWALNATPVP